MAYDLRIIVCFDYVHILLKQIILFQSYRVFLSEV